MSEWKLEKITLCNDDNVTFLVRGEEGDCGENVFALLDWQGAMPETLEDAMDYDWYPLTYVADNAGAYVTIPPAIAAGDVDFNRA